MKAETLELKHLAPYLPYGLKISDTSQKDYFFDLKEWLFREKQFVKPFFENHLDQILNDDSIKPILRPLSDLTKEIDVNGEIFNPLLVIGQIIDNEYVLLHDNGEEIIVGKDISPCCGHPYDCDCISESFELFYKDYNFYSSVYQDGNPDDIVNEIVHESYHLIQKLFEWHFDVFGLIQNELAIDINTL